MTSWLNVLSWFPLTVSFRQKMFPLQNLAPHLLDWGLQGDWKRLLLRGFHLSFLGKVSSWAKLILIFDFLIQGQRHLWPLIGTHLRMKLKASGLWRIWRMAKFLPEFQRSDCAIDGTEQPAAVPCTCFEIEWTILFCGCQGRPGFLLSSLVKVF